MNQKQVPLTLTKMQQRTNKKNTPSFHTPQHRFHNKTIPENEAKGRVSHRTPINHKD